jgi:VWFA-related protein
MLLLGLSLMALPVAAQQNLPDGPTPKNPTPQSQFPENAPQAPKNAHPDLPPTANPTPTPQAQTPQPEQNGIADRRDALFKLSIAVNFVQIPVTVKDSSGHLVPSLGPNDFTVYEDGVPQRITFLTSDSFPISAAVVIATDMPSTTMKKVNESLPALIGAFSEFDEVALYRYGATVQQISGFTAAPTVSTVSLNRIKRPGREGGPPMLGGPFSGGPSINGHSIGDPNAGSSDVSTAPRESYVLNDAILRAAQDLSRRDKSRRRIIFVVSDGRELRSNARYDEVRKILLSNNIAVYALGVDTAAIPIYDRLNRVRLPGFGYGDLLPKYASDTGGSTFAEFDRQSIEQAYSRITEVARNQYTLGYTTRATASSSYRTIDVRVHRPGLIVFAKQGYYPLPPQPHQKQ